jgi:tripartite ATP-independent transporter DctM subunit
MIFELFGPAMFILLLVLLFSGYPVAFSLGGIAVLFALLASAFGYFSIQLFMAFPERVFGLMSNYILLSIPFFIFMGTILEKTKIAEDLLKTIGILFGRIRGGLAIAVVLVGTLLAAATGVVGASVVAMGMISLPVMLKYGYSKQLATGIIAASGTLGQIIPPSIVLIVLADQLGVSVGDLFIKAFTPGILLSFLYIVYVIYLAIFQPALVPALPESERTLKGAKLFQECLYVMVTPLLLIMFVLGSIFIGIATPTEAGSFGALSALLLAYYRKRLSKTALIDSMNETLKLTVMIMFLLVGSTAFSLVFRCVNGDLWIQELLTNILCGKIGLLLIVNAVIFVLGFFIDFFEIVFIIVPLIVPAAKLLGIDLIWLGVVLAINIQTSFLTPPFGFSLFYLKGVCPENVQTKDIYKGIIPFLFIQVFVLVSYLTYLS